MKAGMAVIPPEPNPPSDIFVPNGKTKMAAVNMKASTLCKRTYIFCMMKIINTRMGKNSEFTSYNFHIKHVCIQKQRNITGFNVY
jgi:hypothetical protein